MLNQVPDRMEVELFFLAYMGNWEVFVNKGVCRFWVEYMIVTLTLKHPVVISFEFSELECRLLRSHPSNPKLVGFIDFKYFDKFCKAIKMVLSIFYVFKRVHEHLTSFFQSSIDVLVFLFVFLIFFYLSNITIPILILTAVTSSKYSLHPTLISKQYLRLLLYGVTDI